MYYDLTGEEEGDRIREVQNARRMDREILNTQNIYASVSPVFKNPLYAALNLYSSVYCTLSSSFLRNEGIKEFLPPLHVELSPNDYYVTVFVS
jgi:hypothetical protein